jgi:acyl phosphate:glycerol-3-phosphate acyltransferase
MDVLLTVAAAFAPAYLLGSVPFGLIVARLFKGIDIRQHGSKNIGATNVARVCGRPWGVLVFALDFLKGVLPATLWGGSRVFQGWAGDLVELAPLLAGLGSILGHVFPAWLGFRGGRGVATAAGVFVVLTPLPAGIALATWALLAVLFRYVSLASVVAAVALLAAQLLLDDKALAARLPITIFVAAIVTLVILRHVPNLRRLAAGTESKIGAKRTADAPPPAATDPGEPPQP